MVSRIRLSLAFFWSVCLSVYREMALNNAEVSYGERELKIIGDFQGQIESLKIKYETWIAQEIHRANDITSRREEEQVAHEKAIAKYDT